MNKSFAKNTAIYVALIAMFSAILVGGKMALVSIPNVEVVTIITAVCAYVWGLWIAMPVTVVGILVQIPIFGFNTWVLEYFIHWPIVAILFAVLGKVKFKNRAIEVVAATSVAVVMTTLFGVMTSIVDTFLAFSSTAGFKIVIDDFWQRFAVLYVRGIVFFIVHIVCNLVLFSVAFVPLCNINIRAKRKFMLNLSEQVIVKQENLTIQQEREQNACASKSRDDMEAAQTGQNEQSSSDSNR